MSMSSLYLVTALAAALMAGFFFSFSVVVMDGLEAVPPLDGMRAMQAINMAVPGPWFGLAFFGTPLLCLLVVLSLLWPAGRSLGGWIAALGAVLYIALVFAITLIKNVPMNQALATATDAGAWQNFLPPWTYWNHVRTIGSLAASCLLALGYALGSRS